MITGALLVMVPKAEMAVSVAGETAPRSHCEDCPATGHCSCTGSLVSAMGANRRGPLARGQDAEKKLDPGTHLLYKNIKVVGTGMVWAAIRECFSVLNMKPIDKEQAGLKGYKHFLVSYKAKGSRQTKVMNNITKAGNHTLISHGYIRITPRKREGDGKERKSLNKSQCF